MRSSSSTLELDDIKKIYAGYSGIYDFLFKRFFFPRQKYVIKSLGIRPGERILDVGVGTGLSLTLYPSYAQVVGIDISSGMLKQAAKKVRKYNLSHVKLLEMDASCLAFADDAFDYVIAAHVVSVVPDPVKVVDEVKRVAKKDGRIIIINHFQSANPVVAKVEEWITPLCKRMGWRSDLTLAELVRQTNLQIAYEYQLNKLDLWKVICAVNNK